MGCGFASTTRGKSRHSAEGHISKEDFILRKGEGFTSEYTLDKCLGCGTPLV